MILGPELIIPKDTLYCCTCTDACYFFTPLYTGNGEYWGAHCYWLDETAEAQTPNILWDSCKICGINTECWNL